MRFERRDANEHGDTEWVLMTDDSREHPMGITIFQGGIGYEIVTGDGDVIGTAGTLGGAKRLALSWDKASAR